MNAVILIDYENFELLMKYYSVDPLKEINFFFFFFFFPVILDKLKNMNLNVIECICYANVESRSGRGPPLL